MNNKLINQLMIEAEQYALSITNDINHIEYNTIRNEHFTQQIVNMCLNVCDTFSQGPRDDGYRVARLIHQSINAKFRINI